MDDDRDREVAGLRVEGYSFRQIAQMMGMSLGAVQRALRRAQQQPQDLDDDDDVARFPLDVVDDDPVPTGSVRFTGVDEFDERIEVFTDERGQRFDLLDLYRHGPVDGGALFGDACRQLEDAGRRPKQSGPSA
jgi:hypothetical protein